MLNFTHALCLTYIMDGEGVQKTGNNVSTKKTWGKSVHVVKVRHKKVVIAVHGIHGKKTQWPGIATAGVSFSLEDSIEKYSRCGKRALSLLLCLCIRSCFGRLPPSTGKAVVLVRNRHLFLCRFLYMTCFMLLIADYHLYCGTESRSPRWLPLNTTSVGP